MTHCFFCSQLSTLFNYLTIFLFTLLFVLHQFNYLDANFEQSIQSMGGVDG